jgi:hypothetical protein
LAIRPTPIALRRLLHDGPLLLGQVDRSASVRWRQSSTTIAPRPFHAADSTRFAAAHSLSSICQPDFGKRGNSCRASVEWPSSPREFPNVFQVARFGILFALDDAMIRRARMTIARLEKRMNGRFTALERRMNDRFTALERRMNGRFTKLERRTNRRFASVDARFDAVDARFTAVDARFDAVDAGLDRMEARIGARFDSVIEKLDTHFRINKNRFDHHDVILHEHEDRLKDLERQTGT